MIQEQFQEQYQEYYCGLKEHQIVTSVCVMENCDYQQKLVCKKCNSKQFHNHNQDTNSHLLDLEMILKNQQALKDQQFQYHTKILKFKEMLDIMRICKSHLNDLDSILNQYIYNFKKYFANLHMIQIKLSSKDFQMIVNHKLAQIIKEVNDFNEEENKQKIQIVANEVLINISKLNYQIQEKVEKISDKNFFQVVCQNEQIKFAQVSPNGQDLLFASNQKLYSYNIHLCSYQQICNISDTTKSLLISKDYQQFYFESDGAIKIYNRNLNKYEQIKLQKGELNFIMVLSKVLASAYYERMKQLYIINLKLKKIIFKLQYDNIVYMHYIEDQNLLIVAQIHNVDIIMLNSKFKSQKLGYNHTHILNMQFNLQNQQLIILDDQWLGIRGILTFWNLDKNGQFIKSLFQTQIEQSLIRNMRFIQSQQQYLVFSDSEIIFYNVQGQIIQRLSCIFRYLSFKNTFSNYCQEPIPIKQYDNNFHHDSIILLWANQM